MPRLLLVLATIITSPCSGAREVAVIVGGYGTGALELEIYSQDLADPSCVANVSLPAMPSTGSFSGIFVPGWGLLFCGVSTSKQEHICYSLEDGRNSSKWINFSSSSLPVKSDLLLGYPGGGDEEGSLWAVGSNKYSNNTWFKDKANTPGPWEKGVDLPFQLQFECSVKVNVNNVTLYLVTGGEETYWEDGPQQKFSRTFVFCKDFHPVFCQEGDGENWTWYQPDLFPRLGNYSLHTCTRYHDPDKGESILVVGGGTSENRDVRVLHLEECTKGNCGWMTMCSNIYSNLINGKMVNLNGRPVLFGGAIATYSNSSLTPVDEVWSFDVEYGTHLPKWNPLPPLKSARWMHTVVSVPESFFCKQSSTTTTPSVTAHISSTSSSSPSTATIYTTYPPPHSSSTSSSTPSTEIITSTASTSKITSLLTTYSTSSFHPASTTSSASSTSLSSTNPTTSPIHLEIRNHTMCAQLDSRLSHWVGEAGENATHVCPSKTENKGTALAWWKCSGSSGQFETQEPDRTECVHEWIGDIDNMLANENETALSVTEAITFHIREDGPLYGGDIIHLSKFLGRIMSRHAKDDMFNNSEEVNHNFTENMFCITDMLLGSAIGWQEVIDNQQRFEATSKILENVDNVSFLYLDFLEAKACSQQLVLLFEHVQVKMELALKKSFENTKCYYFEKASICLPTGVFQDIGLSCVSTVASYYKIQSQTEMMPEIFENKETNSSVIISLSVENGTKVVIPQNEEPFEIIFKHENIEDEMARSCAFWDFSTSSWSGEGCHFNSEKSSVGSTTCQCYHLTNFGLMLDYTGNSDPYHPFLYTFSLTASVLSMVCIIITEVILFYQKTEIRNQRRRTSERFRNLFLFLGLFTFQVLVDRELTQVEDLTCEIFGATCHLFWMYFWLWAGIESLFLYGSISRVFTQNSLHKFIYFLGFALPFIYVSSLLVFSIITESEVYIRYTSDGSKTACWLKTDMMMFMVVPVALVLLWNILVTVKAVWTAFESATFRQVGNTDKVLAALRNTLILTSLLGLNFLLGMIPVSSPNGPQQYVFVFLNSCSGVFILIASILTNQDITARVRKSFSSGPTRSDIVDGTSSMDSLDTRDLMNRIRTSFNHNLFPSSSPDRSEELEGTEHVLQKAQKASTDIIFKICLEKELKRLKQH